MLSSDARLKDLVKLFHSSRHTRMYHFVSVDQWNAHWSHCDEKTSPSVSGLHYGNYKGHTHSMLISTVKCNLVNLAVKNGTPLERWKRGVSVMLEKAPGHFLV